MDKFQFTEFLLELQVEGVEKMLVQHVSTHITTFAVMF